MSYRYQLPVSPYNPMHILTPTCYSYPMYDFFQTSLLNALLDVGVQVEFATATLNQ